MLGDRTTVHGDREALTLLDAALRCAAATQSRERI
jgi:hypothetical protein